MTSLPRVGVTSRRRSGAKSPAPLEQAPTPVQLAVPPPRWSLTSRIKERDIWGLGLSSDLPVDEDALFAPKVIPRADRSPDAPYSSLSRRVGAIRLSSDTDVRTPDANGSHSAHRHPLQGKCLPSAEDVTATEVFSDVSRPALRRLTSDMERIAGEGSSRRGSASESRKGKEKAEVEVEVLIHQVAPNETVAGIALLYGIDLSTLRKANKLWPSDPAHLRKHLYVPLEACRWDKAKGSGGIHLVRGPGEGQVTLVEKGVFLAAAGAGDPEGYDVIGHEGNLVDVGNSEPESQGKDKDRTTPIPEPSPIQWTGWASDSYSATLSTHTSTAMGDVSLSPSALDDPWASSTSGPSTAAPSTAWPNSVTSDDPGDDQEHFGKRSPPVSRILDVVRIPASQLRFFPSSKPTPGSSRTSFDSSSAASRASLQITHSDVTHPKSDTSGPSITNEMHYNDSAGLPPKPRGKSTMVRLRPPASGELPPTTLVNRISNFFAIPPPPPGMGTGAPRAVSSFARNSRSTRHASVDVTGARMSLDSAQSAYTALSGRSGGSTRSTSTSGGVLLSRSGSLRALGLSGLETVGEPAAGVKKRDEVEMQRRGSEDTLRPRGDDAADGIHRIGSLRRGKKLD